MRDVSGALYMLVSEARVVLVLGGHVSWERFTHAHPLGRLLRWSNTQITIPPKRFHTAVQSGQGIRNLNLPSNLLNDLTDESRALAQVTLGAGHAGLVDAESRLLYSGNKARISTMSRSIIC